MISCNCCCVAAVRVGSAAGRARVAGQRLELLDAEFVGVELAQRPSSVRALASICCCSTCARLPRRRHLVRRPPGQRRDVGQPITGVGQRARGTGDLLVVAQFTQRIVQRAGELPDPVEKVLGGSSPAPAAGAARFVTGGCWACWATTRSR
jgi:hypothetical protein